MWLELGSVDSDGYMINSDNSEAGDIFSRITYSESGGGCSFCCQQVEFHGGRVFRPATPGDPLYQSQGPITGRNIFMSLIVGTCPVPCACLSNPEKTHPFTDGERWLIAAIPFSRLMIPMND